MAIPEGKEIFKERLETGACPICGKVTIETKEVEHPKFGKIKICKSHAG